LAWHALTNDARKTDFPRRKTRIASIYQSIFAPTVVNDLRRKMRGWLRCQRPLIIKGKPIPGHGCNSWKGKFYDAFLRDLLRADFQTKQLNSRHQIALFSAGYLGLFRQFGYQIALLPTGLLMRNQFFHPNSFLRDVPPACQMMLTGNGLSNYDEATRTYWTEPFKINVDDTSAFIVLRNMSFKLPLSRDPTLPLARALPYAPSKYAFRPDLTTVFE
jgi:hypothetical protein